MKLVSPSEVKGGAFTPPSKSATIRAFAAAALADGKSTITNPSDCDDALSALKCIKALGSAISYRDCKVIVEGRSGKIESKLDCGESGLCIRMFSSISALFDRRMILVAKGSLKKREVGFIEAPLKSLGAECSTNNGFPPVKVKGPISGRHVFIDGSHSSQFLSGLLIALPLCASDSTIYVANLKSKPYITMTLNLLREFGIKIRPSNDFSKFSIFGNQYYKPSKYIVEGDWSSASFLLVAGAIAGKVKVKGINPSSCQADRAIIDGLIRAGASVKTTKNTVEVQSNTPLRGFEFDATHCPDLFPPLAVLACCCKGKTRLKGASRLKGKESDRGKALVSELGKLGAKIALRGDVLEIVGSRLHGGIVDSHNDHRIAMACAIAGLVCERGVSIKNPQCVKKSFPRFFDVLENLRS
ncbi:MAG: 3-phosphoshikimate 1-carboxyvinyltransferase [Candidatus Anstonellaceae archaeon]